MSRLNTPASGPSPRTHEGAPVAQISPLKELRRSILTSLLWEDKFYETGSDHAKRIVDLVPQCKSDEVAALAVEARDRMYLRHVPLFLVRQLARIKGNGPLVADTLERVVQRPDEMGEYLAMYWDGVTSGVTSGNKKRPQPLSKGSQRGLARAFAKFNEYALAKYDRDTGVKLRDVLRLAHPKPKDAEQSALWKRTVARELVAPDTWEVALSGGADKKETFERLLRERKLGALAFLRNLRNMVDARVEPDLIRERFSGPLDKVLPFRFIAAARHAPAYAQDLNDAMLRVTTELPRLSGLTAVLVDISGSMDDPLSAKSEMKRMDVAAGLAVLVRELGHARIFSFSNQLVEVPAFRGLPLVEKILSSQQHGGTYLGRALEAATKVAHFDRMIVITDEQSHDRVSAPTGRGYVINVATNQHGVGYGQWTHIDGWSERVLDFIREVEAD